jgi:hypothetical protein
MRKGGRYTVVEERETGRKKSGRDAKKGVWQKGRGCGRK